MTDEGRKLATHELKCWPPFYQHLLTGDKTFEARKDDRGFRAGDILWLREWSQDGGYTGREMHRTVTYLLAGMPWLRGDYVIMALSPLRASPQPNASPQPSTATLVAGLSRESLGQGDAVAIAPIAGTPGQSGDCPQCLQLLKQEPPK